MCTHMHALTHTNMRIRRYAVFFHSVLMFFSEIIFKKYSLNHGSNNDICLIMLFIKLY